MTLHSSDQSSGSDPWPSFVVVPCLNERESLEATCRSLGFAAGAQPPVGCSLILIDNGPTDGTLALCRKISRSSSASVVVAQERERGYVPARRRGIEIATDLSRDLDVALDHVVVIQADADTIYSRGYALAMLNALAQAGPDHMALGATARSGEFAAQHPLVSELEETDQSVDIEWARDFDVVVDDKACAFTLDDYHRWGGHRREYLSDGEELLAETTRLFIAGRVGGARRVDVDGAVVLHSPRRIETDAAQHLAAAGYPYSRRQLLGVEPISLEALERQVATGDLGAADR